MSGRASPPELVVADVAAWRAWLEENHATSDGVWLLLGKKGGDATALTYVPAVEEALCFGWIDSQTRRRDDVSYWQRMTPRRSRSIWSASNVERVTRLEAEGRMREAGRVQVRAAQADGRWDQAYGGSDPAPVPDDLAAALAAEPRAQAMFDVLTASNRLQTVFHVQSARRPETRARRVEAVVAMLARGETFLPQRRRPDEVPGVPDGA